MSRSPCADGGARTTLLRHRLGARVLHAVDALLVLVLLASGIALGSWLSPQATALLGGHEALAAAHQKLGLVFVIAWLLMAAWAPARWARVLCDVLHFRRRDRRWPVEFLRHYRHPKGHAAPFHDGRFDPVQRLVFLGLIAAIALASASGIALYLAPFGPSALAWAVRVHGASVGLLLACLGVHIAAGSGVLRTHRGLARAMFGNGQVPVPMAQALWPAWTRHELGAQARGTDEPSPVAPAHDPSPAGHRTRGSRK